MEERVTEGEGSGGVDEPESALFDRALRLVMESGIASASRIQRLLQLRYSVAVALVERMEALGFVSAPGVNGARVVFDQEPARSVYQAAQAVRMREMLGDRRRKALDEVLAFDRAHLGA